MRRKIAITPAAMHPPVKKEKNLGRRIRYVLLTLGMLCIGALVLDFVLLIPVMLDQVLHSENYARPAIEMGLTVKTIFGFMAIFIAILLLTFSVFLCWLWQRCRLFFLSV